MTPKTTSTSGSSTTTKVNVPHEKIAMRAYEKWCQRGRTHGHHLQDWLEAERELQEEYARGTSSTGSTRR